MPHDLRYRIEGMRPLRGEVMLSGAKNAALPCMCAALLTTEEVVLRNVPEIADVFSLLEIFDYLNVEYSFRDHVLTICAKNLSCKKIPHELVKKFRASILLLGPLLVRCGEVQLAYPGGCVIGKRPVDAHLDAFVQLGATNHSTQDVLHLRGTLHGGEIILPEFSVTATENVLFAAACAKGETTIHIAAAEPHVQDLCRCLEAMGAHIAGIGSHDLFIDGRVLCGAEHSVTSDYLEAGFFALAGALTGGDVCIRKFPRKQLLLFLKVLESLQLSHAFEAEDILRVRGGSALQATRIKTNVFPGYPTDLQAVMGVAMTQAHGVSRIFERMFEGRFGYLFELEKMGANVEMLTAHESLIIGPTPLHGRTVTSNDIRAGAAMVLAALCAHGETLLTDVQYIERGYEGLPEKLCALGASVRREGAERIEASSDLPLHSAHAHDHPTRERRNPVANLSENTPSLS